jgi:hypothetical protein
LIPPDVLAMLGARPEIERNERRARWVDWLLPLSLMLAALVQADGVGCRLMVFAAGFAAGACAYASYVRRRKYRVLRASLEDLDLHVAMLLIDNEGEDDPQ